MWWHGRGPRGPVCWRSGQGWSSAEGSRAPLWKAQHSPGWQSLWLSQMVPLPPAVEALVQRPHTHSWSPQHSLSRVQTCRREDKRSGRNGEPSPFLPRSWREHRSANPHPPPITDRRTPRSGGLLGMPRGAEVRAGQVEGNMASAGSLCSSRLYKGWSHRLGSPTDLDLASFLLGRKMAYGPQTQAESESDCLIKAPAWAAPWMGRPWVPRPWSHTESVAPSSRPSTGRAGQGSKKPSTS